MTNPLLPRLLEPDLTGNTGAVVDFCSCCVALSTAASAVGQVGETLRVEVDLASRLSAPNSVQPLIWNNDPSLSHQAMTAFRSLLKMVLSPDSTLATRCWHGHSARCRIDAGAAAEEARVFAERANVTSYPRSSARGRRGSNNDRLPLSRPRVRRAASQSTSMSPAPLPCRSYLRCRRRGKSQLASQHPA